MAFGRGWDAGVVIEFLIRHADEVPVIPGDVRAVLTPTEVGAEHVAGWGDHRVRVGDTEISFALEPAGWQLSFEGPMALEAAEQFVSAVADRMAAAVGESMKYVCISQA